MVDLLSEEKYGFTQLLEIMDRLRGAGGCPWDMEQDHKSIRRNFIEEVYEAVEAIDLGDNRLLCEELGDVLLQVVFHARIAKDEGAFDILDVTDGICRKLILRHPHIFGDAVAETSNEVLASWEEIKRKEKNQKSVHDSMEQVARSLPALIYAEKIQSKAKKVGFDWDDVSGALDKVSEEKAELSEAVKSGEGVYEELGDLLFAVVNVARFLQIDPEKALVDASLKFKDRFSKMEEKAGFNLEGMSLKEMDKLWDEVKQEKL